METVRLLTQKEMVQRGHQQGTVATYEPKTQECRQKDYEFENSLGFTASLKLTCTT